MSTEQSSGRTVAVVTLGCARNEVDSEEMAGRLGADGWQVTEDAERADVVLVNTCGFIAQAKADSIETILGATDDSRTVVAAGCLAERYGRDLAAELPEVTVLGFDDYPQISARLDDAIEGRTHVAHEPRDRRLLLPLTPVDRDDVAVPGHHGGPSRLLRQGVSVPVKLASGCDRRCSFCAIPRFRGAFVSRRPTHVRDEVRALAADGVREVVLVSENSTSYGKDLGDLRLLESLLPDLGATPGLLWTRVSYLQPAEMRPGLVESIGGTPGVAAYFDLSFQHASGAVLRRMRRFGDGDAFLELIARIREVAPTAGIRSNFIVGFPGETEEDLGMLTDFLTAAQLDAIGVFAYSSEESTEAADFDDHLDEQEVALRTGQVHALADALMEQRAESRVGESTRLLVESVDVDAVEGRCEHQGPEDATTRLVDLTGAGEVAPGDDIPVQIVGTDGVDLLARRLP